MAVGERMRWFRKRMNLTQRELGVKVGFNKKNADMRIGQYETGQRNPKDQLVNDLADIFDVVPEALSGPDIDSYIGLMHTLFTLEDRYGLTVTTLDGQVCLKQDVNHPNYSITLAEDLLSWNELKTKLTTGSLPIADYDHWRYNFPKDRAAGAKERLDGLKELDAKEER